MQISARAHYACLAVIELAKAADGGPRRAYEIAEAHGIPERYLMQILRQLKAGGFVTSARGSDGGYLLARSADQIAVVDVLDAIDGRGESPKRTSSSAGYELSKLLLEAQGAGRQILAAVTIADLADRAAPLDWVL